MCEKKIDTGRAVDLSKKLTKELPHDAGLPVKPVIPAGVGEIAAIQRILPDYQIQCYTVQGGSLIYQGPEAPRKIYLILDEFNFSGNMWTTCGRTLARYEHSYRRDELPWAFL